MGGEENAKGSQHAEEYPPTAALAKKAHVGSLAQYQKLYKQSLEQPEVFWGNIAEQFYWKKRWESPFHRFNFDVNKGPIKIEWFIGAETNVCYNCLDRHIEKGLGDRIAFYCEGNDLGQESTITFKQLLDMVCKIANYMKSIGVKERDDVTIYMPMVAELPAAMLACARIGAVHSVVFGGFSAESLAGRILDSKPRVVLTASAVRRTAKTIDLKGIVDDALSKTEKEGHKVPHVVLLDNKSAAKRAEVHFVEGRDVWWDEAVAKQASECAPVWLDAEAPLFKLYTSGSTGKPKGVEHTQAGYMVGAATTFKYVFDYHEDDIFWCTADCGWITGHSYVTYGPLLNAASQVIFEGVPTYPDAGRPWDITDKYKVTLLYTAPTAIRSLMSFGDKFVTKYKRDSLRILGTVGEPINKEAWLWYYNVVGGGRTPIVDTWWQTETGAHMITPLPGATTLKPGSATLPFFGVEPVLLDDKVSKSWQLRPLFLPGITEEEEWHIKNRGADPDGKEIEGVGEGYLMIKRSWPSSMRTLSGDHERFQNVYFSNYPGYYFTGDGARRDADGYYWLIGRVDDVINVSGHRIGTAEVEGALDSHPSVSEAAVVPMTHAVKGQGIYAFVSLMDGHDYPPPESLKKELIATVRRVIGPIATPDVIHWAPGLPKTRSGKIMRRILRKIASKEEEGLGDISTLADTSVVEQLISLRGK